MADPVILKETINIGSSNDTRRAYSLDLESNAIIVTKDGQLRENIQQELDNILKYTKPVNLEDFSNEAHKQLSAKVKVASPL
ncbi:CDP-diacylglycerol--glycerol-3-phosphate 3-phosphatidyltransferase [Nakaseomyces glabratus]|nr:CDP-diacylglycerol--glycerol-3-phosphate 3-phosphatidyltransferase [Nakaseomyces glabratus]KTB26013.1 CDP-diacylglycerol--glycerol-3-phosphate 3-phosphatidyltransferase [Nakaseomyces glabratus]